MHCCERRGQDDFVFVLAKVLVAASMLAIAKSAEMWTTLFKINVEGKSKDK
jgi:hypothetical protein